MRERTLKTIYLLLVVLMAVSLSTAVFGKSSKKSAKTSGIKVPASILNGSDVTANRSFKNLNVKETTLAGIKLGSSNKAVLQKYGNPTRIIVHSEPVQTNQMGMGPGMNGGMPGMNMPGAGMGMGGAMGMNMPGAGMPGMGGMPGMPGMAGDGMAPGMGMPGMAPAPGPQGIDMGIQMPGQMNDPAMNGMPMRGPSTMPGQMNDPAMMNNGMPGVPGGMPGMPGMAGDGMPGMPGAMGMNNVPVRPNFFGTSTRIASTSICWQYDLSSGVQLEFIIKDGKVSQITVLSLYPWKFARLNCGLMIGDTYKLVTYIWGVNYKQQQIGAFTRMTYWDKKGTALIFLNKKLVGMTIAAGDPII